MTRPAVFVDSMKLVESNFRTMQIMKFPKFYHHLENWKPHGGESDKLFRYFEISSNSVLISLLKPLYPNFANKRIASINFI